MHHRPWLEIPLFVVLIAGGCVIPVGPQFGDSEDNYPPFVISSDPGVGDIFTEGGGNGREISVRLSDHNLGDQLYIRWFVDYPGNGATAKQLRDDLRPAAATPERAAVHIQPKCAFAGLAPGPHRLTMSVSDRPYLDAHSNDNVSPDAPLDSPRAEGNRIRVVWTLNCQ